jgi:hypothetical protein
VGTSEASGSEKGVTAIQPGVHLGANLYLSGHAGAAFLVDMDGTELHRWQRDFNDIWPDVPRPKPAETYWRRAYLFENGDLLSFYANRVKGLFKLDKDSNLLWELYDLQTHHDLDVLDNGDIYVLTRDTRVIHRIDASYPVVEDFVTILDANGKVKRSVSLLDAMENSAFLPVWQERHEECRDGFEKLMCADIFHTNSLEILDGRLANVIPAFESGNVLVSFRPLDAIAVVDLDAVEVVWLHQGSYGSQHDPTVLENGNILLFDNEGEEGGASSVLEIDPVSGETVWEYRGTEERPFYSPWMGTAQRLPNGNTLITESENGRVFEVTREQEIVWEFYNPNRAGENDEYIGVIFEMLRLPPERTFD